MSNNPRRYTRWTREPGGRKDAALTADILAPGSCRITANPFDGTVSFTIVGTDVPPLAPDEARLIGVQLIEAAALADGDRAIREVGT